MTSKFGLLVLLLVLENAVAKQRLSRNPTGSLVSAFQQIPNHRQDLLRTDYSTACAEKNNKKDCNIESACAWSSDWEECQYVDLRKGHEDSPCAKAAPLHFDLEEAKTQCPKQDSAERCRSNKLCYWYSYGSRCYYDRDFILYGIKNFHDKVNQILHSKEIGATVRAQYEALQSSDDFTWESLLEYKLSLDCPSDIEQLVCDFAATYASEMVNRELYCHKKYESTVSDCIADPLCVWNKNLDECERNDSAASVAGNTAANKVLVASMSEGAQKSIFEAVSACATILESKECKGQCIWDLNRYRCRLRKDHIAALLIEPGKNDTDALCEYLKTDGSSDCYNRIVDFFARFLDFSVCYGSEFCRVNEDWQCVPKEEFYLSAAADRDSQLKEKYQSLKKQCSIHTTKKDCVDPSKVY